MDNAKEGPGRDCLQNTALAYHPLPSRRNIRYAYDGITFFLTLEAAVDIRQLELVDVLARTGSLTKAALGLGTTAPGVKRLLDNLEHETGLALFSRSNRGVVLTAQGREFLSHAKKALAELRDGVVSAARMEPEPARLRIVEVHGYQYYIPYNCFLAALASFKGARPDVDVSIDSIPCMENPRPDSLYIGALDEDDVDGLGCSEIHRVQMYGLISPCDPLVGKARLELSDS